MPKTNITSYSTSQSLKSGMQAAGNYPVLSDMHAFYSAQNAKWVAISTINGGLMRCIGNTGDFTDLFDVNDPEIVRAWSMVELTNWFVDKYVYDNYSSTVQGANHTISFTVGGLPFSGTAGVEVDAFAIAIITLLNSAVAANAVKKEAISAAAPAKTASKKK